MITLAATLSALQAMTVSGVTTYFDDPPPTIYDHQLPAAFPSYPAGRTFDQPAFSCTELGRRVSVQYIIAVERVNQSVAINQATRPEAFESIFEMMDELAESLSGLSFANFVEYQIRLSSSAEAIQLGHWCILAVVSGRDA